MIFPKTLFASIRLKIFFFVFCISLFYFILYSIEILEIREQFKNFNLILRKNTAINIAASEALTSTRMGISYIQQALLINDPTLRRMFYQYENNFEESMSTFEMYIKVLMWGSNSDAFKKAKGGLIYEKWVRGGFNKKIVLEKSPQEILHFAGVIDLHYSGFSKYARLALDDHKQFLRYLIENNLTESEKYRKTAYEYFKKAMSYEGLAAENIRNLMRATKSISEASIFEIKHNQEAAIRISLVTGLGFFGAALALFWILLRRDLISPIEQLTAGAKKIAYGSLDEKISVSSSDEIGQLAVAFDDMRRQLKDSYSALEKKVADKTSELASSLSELKKQKQHLEAIKADLERSNHDLEQYAYVASHDLWEPLRVASNCIQILQRRYQKKLDQSANEIIDFAVSGMMRMQNLINDLLAYSRLKAEHRPLQSVDCQEVCSKAIDNLKVAIQNSKGKVTYDDLPVVLGDEVLLIQLFQNLISNAIKFHGPSNPKVHISARRDMDKWLFSIADNGIGIDAQYCERVFDAFKRLPGSDKSPGSGIGLAICKKVVEQHKGDILLKSEKGIGSTFYFTLSAV